jgi:ribosomal protein S25
MLTAKIPSRWSAGSVSHGVSIRGPVTATSGEFVRIVRDTTPLDELQSTLAELSSRLAAVERKLSEGRPEVRLVRELDWEDALDRVAELLKAEGQLYPSEIAERLGLPYEQAITVLQALEHDGVVAPAHE